MPFTFKLSKRLARLKVSLALAAAAALAACESTPATGPNALNHSLAFDIATSCLTSAGAWQNGSFASQTGAFEAQFDVTTSQAKMAAVVGLANGPAAAYTALAGIVAFQETGVIEARNGGAYAGAVALPYSPGTTYHFRLDVNLASHTYDIYVTPAGAAEQLLGSAFAFRTEQAAVSVLNDLGLYAGVGSATACNLTITAWSPPLSLTSAGAWQNRSFPAQTGAFEAQFDATPSQANMNGVVGLANGPAAAYTDLAGILAFQQTGVIEARNGGAYAAAAALRYSAGTTYHFRLDVNLASHTYDIYVTPAGAAEQLLGSAFAFRTEQAAVSVLNNLGLYASVGSVAVRNVTLAAWTPPQSLTSAGAWQNRSFASQTGAFEAQFDVTPGQAKMAAVVGLANGPAPAYTALASVVAFQETGVIEARNGGAYAAAAALPYSAGTTYHVRLDVNLAAHTYDIYVTPAGAAEQLLGSAFAFRTEQAAVSVLNNLGLYASVGSVAVRNVTLAAWTPPPPAPVATVTVSPAVASVSVGATVPLAATLKDASGNVLTGRSVTWASSTRGMASVSTGGFVTGVAVGPVTITATSEGQSGRATVTVNPVAGNPVAGPTPLYTLGNGANYYVAPSGSDANPCTTTAPCYTMARVSQLMRPGDNAHFASGNYTWTYSGNKVSVSGTAAAPISYISDTKWGAKVYGSGCDPIWNSGAYVQIINFDVTGNCSDGIGVNGNYDKVIGNRVHDLPGTGGYAGIHADCCDYNIVGIEIIGNVVDNIAMGTGSNLIHGIYAAGPSSVIMNNIVTRVSAACITHYHGSTRSIVSNNIVANCKYGIQIAADGAITSDDYTTVDNNIAVNNGRGIYEYPTAGPHNVYNNNIVYNNSTANFDLCCGGTQSGTITLTAAQFSALFVNYTGDMTGDYHLRSGAVAIDAGTTQCAAGVVSCVPLLDFDGVPRPQGLAPDIGTYEWR